jgi:prepilin-type processing-associated H-X9-DG protein
MNNEGFKPTGESWRNLPGSYHNGAGSFSFADGHSEIHKWMVRSGANFPTVWPVKMIQYTASNPGPWASASLSRDADYEWLDDRTPYQPN